MDPARAARHGDRDTLAPLLHAGRADTLASFAAIERARPGQQVPLRDEPNPPLWELGHIGGFQGWWTTGCPAWRDGHRADPASPRRPGLRPDAGALHDSAKVPHAARWALPLPDAATTKAEIARQLEATLAPLADAPDDGDDTLYAFRLGPLHEDMHHEAALYRAQGLGDRRCWTDAGWHWRQPRGPARVAQLQQAARPGFAVAFISAHEAPAWCRWAGRRLPTEAEWVLARRQAGAAFRWGDVWEWTASAFAPFDGFAPHPCRDDSAPWFDGRPVLKGASWLTQPRLAHPAYRNDFETDRCDIPAGLRSVAL